MDAEGMASGTAPREVPRLTALIAASLICVQQPVTSSVWVTFPLHSLSWFRPGPLQPLAPLCVVLPPRCVASLRSGPSQQVLGVLVNFHRCQQFLQALGVLYAHHLLHLVGQGPKVFIQDKFVEHREGRYFRQ